MECNSNNGDCELKTDKCNSESDCTDSKVCDENHNCVDQNNPCKDVTCSEHGTCINSGMATCNCDEGYKAVDLTCVEDKGSYKGSSLVGCSYNQNSGSPFLIFILLGLALFTLRRKEEE